MVRAYHSVSHSGRTWCNIDHVSLQVENGLIVVAYKDGSPAHAHQLNSELMLEYWKTWLLRLEDFTQQQRWLYNSFSYFFSKLYKL